MKIKLLSRGLAFVVGLASMAGAAFAQPAGGPGPQPVPSPWAVNGNTISYGQGGITVPAGVTGGSQGVGTINASGLYVNGVAVGSGAGSVTSVATGACLTGGPITTTGTIEGTQAFRKVTITTDTIIADDACRVVSYNNGSAIAAAIPQATGSFGSQFAFEVQNTGAGAVTFTPGGGSLINGAPTLTVAQNRGCYIWSDGVDWQVSSCTALIAASPPGGASNTVQINSGGSFGGVGPGTTTTVLHGNASGAPSFGPVANADMSNPATTVNGQTCTLGASCTITASAGTITVGTTTIASGTNNRLAYDNSGVLGEAIIGSGLNLSAGTLTATGSLSGSGTSPHVTCWTSSTALGDCSDQNFAFLDVPQSWTAAQRGTPTTCTLSSVTCTPNFDTGQNISLTLTSACASGCTYANPSTTPVAGQTGVLIMIQDATGNRTINTWGSDYVTTGGVSTLSLSTGANAIDIFSYYIIDSTHIVVTPGALNVVH